MFRSPETEGRHVYRPSRRYVIRLLKLLTLMALAFIAQPASAQPVPPSEQSLSEAQLENQRAQAEYYRAQAKPKSAEEKWGQLAFGLISSLVGAGSALAGVSLTNRWRKKGERLKDKQLSIVDLLKKLSEGIQAASWVTWRPECKGVRQLKDEFAEYESEIKKIFPGVVGARAVVAAFDDKAHEALSPLIQEVYDLDDDIGQVKADFAKATSESEQQRIRERLDGLHTQVDDLDKRMLRKVAEILTALK